jgi:hypothetical protein
VTHKNLAYINLTGTPEEPDGRKKMKVQDSLLERWVKVQEKQLAVSEHTATALEVLVATGAATVEAAGLAWQDLLPGPSRNVFMPLAFGARGRRNPEALGSGTRKDGNGKEDDVDDERAVGEMEGIAGLLETGDME